MLHQVLRQAAEGHEVSCPAENELQIRKDGRTYRFTCGNCELRVEDSGGPEVVFLLAPDATVQELRRFLAELVDSSDTHGFLPDHP